MQNLHDFMHSRRWALRAGVGVALGWTASAGAAPEGVPLVRVLAASDLKFVLTRIAGQYQQSKGVRLEMTFGSSGNMARQIQQGLRADLFMSADEELVLQLARQGLAQGSDTGVQYGLGRLALLAAPGTTWQPRADLAALRAQLPQIRKFAIANPEHAPYGRAAREALQTAGLWEELQPRLVLGDNIAQATQFVLSGAAQAGITAMSLVRNPALATPGSFAELGRHLHPQNPLRQRMLLLRGASGAAADFYRHLQLPATQAVFAQYGLSATP